MRKNEPHLHVLASLELDVAHLLDALELLLLGAQVLLELDGLVLDERLLDLELELLARLLHALLALLGYLLLELVQFAPLHGQLGLHRVGGEVRLDLALAVVLGALDHGLLGQAVVLVALLERLDNHRLRIAGEYVVAVGALVDALGGARLALELDNALAGRLALVVHDDDSALHRPEYGERLLQVLVGHIGREVLDAHGGTVRGKAHAYAATLEHVAVELLLGVLGVEARVEADEAEAALGVQEALAHFAELDEEIAEVGLVRVRGQVANEQSTASGELLVAVLLATRDRGVVVVVVIVCIVVAVVVRPVVLRGLLVFDVLRLRSIGAISLMLLFLLLLNRRLLLLLLLTLLLLLWLLWLLLLLLLLWLLLLLLLLLLLVLLLSLLLVLLSLLLVLLLLLILVGILHTIVVGVLIGSVVVVVVLVELTVSIAIVVVIRIAFGILVWVLILIWIVVVVVRIVGFGKSMPLAAF